MTQPIALCLEDLEAAPQEPHRYLTCTAVSGRGPGLRVRADGAVSWCSEEEVACELCVSSDDKLIAYRPEGAAVVALHRGGRSLAIPAGKPVVLLDQDVIEVSGQSLRVHVHGPCEATQAPEPFRPRRRGSAAKTAAAFALSAAVAMGAGCPQEEVEVREAPPVVEHTPPDAAVTPEKAQTPPATPEKAPAKQDAQSEPPQGSPGGSGGAQ